MSEVNEPEEEVVEAEQEEWPDENANTSNSSVVALEKEDEPEDDSDQTSD